MSSHPFALSLTFTFGTISTYAVFDKEESLQLEKFKKRLILSDMAFISRIAVVLPEGKDRSPFMLTNLFR
jgi:hypothetical protein